MAPDDLGDAQHRLHTAVQQLIQPTTETITRSPADQDPGVRETDAAHAYEGADLRRRHAAALQRHDHPAARRYLERLVAHEHRAQARRTTRARLPSLLDQLLDAVQSTQGGGGASAGPHRSPIGFAAAELLATIRRTVQARPEHDLATRLRSWASLAGHWRTTDPAKLLAAAHNAERWVAGAPDILNPRRRLTAVGACPACGNTTAHIRDDTGETVRRPALEIDPTTGSARCIVPGCTGYWPPERLMLLAAILEQQTNEKTG